MVPLQQLQWGVTLLLCCRPPPLGLLLQILLRCLHQDRQQQSASRESESRLLNQSSNREHFG